jgi:hypothetical protein
MMLSTSNCSSSLKGTLGKPVLILLEQKHGKISSISAGFGGGLDDNHCGYFD